MTIGFTKKLLLIGASVMMLALGAAPAGFAGEDDPGPTANGEQIGSTNSSSGSSSGGSSSGSSSSGSSGSAKSGVKAVQHTQVANRDTTQAVGAAQTGFGGMADTPGGSLLFSLLLGFGGIAMLGAAKLAPFNRGSDR